MKEKTKTMQAFESDIGRVSGSMSDAWRFIFHISRNLHKYADDPKFEEIVDLVKKYENEIYSVSFKFDEEFSRLINS